MWGQDGWILAKFFFCVFMDRDEHKLAKKERGQYPATLTEQTWSIKDLLYGFWWNFAYAIQRVVRAGKMCWQNMYLKNWEIFFTIGLLNGDLLSCNNTTIFNFMNLLLNPEKRFFVMSINDSISVHWRTIIKEAWSLLTIVPVSDVWRKFSDFFVVFSKQIHRQSQA